MPLKSSEAYVLLLDAWRGAQQPGALWELAIIVVAVALAWSMSRLLAPRLVQPRAHGALQPAGLQRVLFPAAALVLVSIGRGILSDWQPAPVLRIAVAVLCALVIVRGISAMVRRTFAPGAALGVWERSIAWTVWTGLVLYLTGLLPALARFLNEIGFGIGSQRVTLRHALEGAIVVLVSLLVALWLGRLIEARLLRADGLQIHLRVMFAKLAQALLVFAAILVALPAVGMDLTVLSVFGGAVGVGLGFGLQKIASNYVSGFIILMDRSVSIGDVIKVESHSGELVKMTARYVVVRNSDGAEILIPNEELVTSPVVNHSYSDPRVRVPLRFKIGYRSDLNLALKLMSEAGAAHTRILADPPPEALVRHFADSGIQLELGVWVGDPRDGNAQLRSELYRAVWESFRRNGIELASTREPAVSAAYEPRS
jgi:small-conductance mechanosensitive channel